MMQPLSGLRNSAGRVTQGSDAKRRSVATDGLICENPVGVASYVVRCFPNVEKLGYYRVSSGKRTSAFLLMRALPNQPEALEGQERLHGSNLGQFGRQEFRIAAGGH